MGFFQQLFSTQPLVVTRIPVNIVNKSSVISNQQIFDLADALQIQVTRDYAPIWGVNAIISGIPKGKNPSPSAWWLNVVDTTEQAGVLGYHTLNQNGMPQGFVFAKTDLDNGLSWTGTASHELLELLTDASCNLCVQSSDGSRLYAMEVCDACEDDQFNYKIKNVDVSDFVFPSFFEGFHKPGSVQFDFMNKITKPYELLPGGYLSFMDIKSDKGWQQETAKEATTKAQIVAGSRRWRRATSVHPLHM